MTVFASILSDFIVGAALVTFYFIVIVAWIFFLYDLFARRDISGWLKAVWLVVGIALPLLGVAVYLIFRPSTAYYAGSEIFDEPGKVNAPMPVSQLDQLARLHDEGSLTDEEFESAKRRLEAA